MSLLFSTRRTASVIALVYCIITQLSAKDFADIREKFPEHGKHMEQVMETYFMESKMMHLCRMKKPYPEYVWYRRNAIAIHEQRRLLQTAE